MPARPKTRTAPQFVPLDVPGARTALLAHYDAHRRDLPWRRTRDPYAIWVSEVMLQQTRVETVIPYYARFLERFPTARALADAPLERVLAAWSGLGYYRRARMLHAGAQAVVERHDGELPADRDALRALPGVGDYTAGALASIAFGLRAPLVDGNVERVLTRLTALGGDPRAAGVKKQVWALASAFADGDRPGDVNQGLMELGATVCTPAAPRCLLCPLQKYCAARAAGEPERYPEKPARSAVREERWCALVARRAGDGAVWLRPSEIGRWAGMLLPPIARTDDAGDAGDAGDHPEGYFARLAGCVPEQVVRVGAVKHVLTHAAMAVEVYTAPAPAQPTVGTLVREGELAALAVPKITLRILESAAAAAEPQARPHRSPRSPRSPRAKRPAR